VARVPSGPTNGLVGGGPAGAEWVAGGSPGVQVDSSFSFMGDPGKLNDHTD
jgi:hypothetical protein